LDETFPEQHITAIQVETSHHPKRKRFICPLDLEWFLRARVLSPRELVKSGRFPV